MIESRAGSFFEQLTMDARFGFRSLTRSRAFFSTAVGTLTLAIAASTIILSVVAQVLVRPLPYRDAERLFMLAEADGKSDFRAASYQTFLDWRRESRTMADLAFVRGGSGLLETADGPARVVFGAVTPGFFQALGVKPTLGRTFGPDDESGSTGDVAVLSYEFWRSQCSSDPLVVGRTIQYDGASVRVIGVVPPGVNSFFPQVSFWRPLTPRMASDPAMANRSLHVDSRVLGRLGARSSLGEARAEFRVMQARQAVAYPSESAGWSDGAFFTLREVVVGDVAPMLQLVAGGVIIVFLIACANVSNLFLVRAIGRQREIAIRQALGATGWRLTRQVSTESALIALVASGGGVVLAAWAILAVRSTAPPELPRVAELRVDWSVLGIAFALAVAVVLIVGMRPALRWRSGKLVDSLRQGRQEGGTAGGRKLRSWLSVGQLGLAIALLICGGLLLRSFRRIQTVDLGYDPKGVIGYMLLPPPKFSDFVSSVEIERRVLDAVRAVPGVSSAALINHLPGTSGVPTKILVPGRESSPDGADVASYRTVSAAYFETMRIPLLHGRWFRESDIHSASDGIVISESVARRYWPNRDPTGEAITIFGSSQSRPDYGKPQPSHVLGVVGDVKILAISGVERHSDVYVPYTRSNWPGSGVVVRTSGDVAVLIGTLRRAVRDVDHDIPVSGSPSAGGFATLNTGLSRSLDTRRYVTWLLGGLAVSALALALIGIFGVVAYGVSQRTHEFGIRLALGAAPLRLFSSVLGEVSRMALTGVALGSAAGLALGHALTGILYDTSPADLPTFVIVIVSVVACSIVACAFPARRAARLDPIVALRGE